MIEGAESELKNVSSVETDPIEIEGVQDSFSLIIPINYQGKYTSLKEDKTVEVEVTITKLPTPEDSSEPQTEEGAQ